MSLTKEVPASVMYWGMILSVIMVMWLAKDVYADVQTLKVKQAVVDARLELILQKVTSIESSLSGAHK